jgi:hypothetical protein
MFDAIGETPGPRTETSAQITAQVRAKTLLLRAACRSRQGAWPGAQAPQATQACQRHDATKTDEQIAAELAEVQAKLTAAKVLN